MAVSDQEAAAARGCPATVAVRGPILSIIQPCFGQTNMNFGHDVADLAEIRGLTSWG